MPRRYLLPILSVSAFLSLPALAAGPDVVVHQLWNMTRWGRVGDISAFSVGTVACNQGDTVVQWQQSTNQHPVIAQNLYRLKSSRFEQIGMAWVKHGFSVDAQNDCATCQDPGNTTQLGIGCSDAYSAGLNGYQGDPGPPAVTNLGPRSQVNAATGFFPYPYSYPNPSTVIDLRLQVHDADLLASQNAGARYFVEAQYVAADDAAANNDNNNNGYHEVTFAETPAGSFNFVPTVLGNTAQQNPAVWAWKAIDSSVVVVNIDVPGDGRFVLAAKVTTLLAPSGLPSGFYRYEYALQNQSSDRSAGSFGIPLESHVPRRNIGFHDVAYHSGEPYDGTDWTTAYTSGRFTWLTVPYATNQNANALRWATLYNFRFDVTAPPISNAQINIGLFKPGSPTSVTASILGPSANAVDCNSNGMPDWQEIQNNPSLDCNNNGNLDTCDPDCNQNGVPDDCEITNNPSLDCDGSGVLDVCEIAVGDPAPGGPFFCTSNCKPDCNHNGKIDSCDIVSGQSQDCNFNGQPDSCDIAQGLTVDCNHNGVPDPCEIAANPNLDCNNNGILDACGEVDCNGNNIPDDCEEPGCPGILAGDEDCNGVVNLSDIPVFVNYVLVGRPSCRADMNHDGKVDGLDVITFTHILVP